MKSFTFSVGVEQMAKQIPLKTCKYWVVEELQILGSLDYMKQT